MKLITGKSSLKNMNKLQDFVPDDRWILAERGKKNSVDPFKPYAFLVEKERSSSGVIEDVAVIFLTDTECPYHCLMCDLWKNTIHGPLPAGAIPRQIEYALGRLPAVRHIKLYNSGSFFDKRAVYESEYEKIAGLINGFKTVIVESHPALTGESCLKFRKMIKGELNVAMGLEIANQDLLNRLNKKLTLQKFRDAAGFLKKNEISFRTFILLRPPFLTEEEGISWAGRSLDFAFGSGSECCTIIPVRAGNGAMDRLQKMGHFTPPSIQSLEKALEYGIKLNSGRVFADTWDLRLFSGCDRCFEKRADRITRMNLYQRMEPEVNCDC